MFVLHWRDLFRGRLPTFKPQAYNSIKVAHYNVVVFVVVVVDTGHQSMEFFRIMRWWISNLGH